MIRTKKELIAKVRKVGEQKIEQGILFKQLAMTIEKEEGKRTLKEWREFVKEFVE